MKENDITFELAFEYLLKRREELNLTTVAEKSDMNRSQLNDCVKGRIKVPKKHRQGIIKWFKSTQLFIDTQTATH